MQAEQQGTQSLGSRGLGRTEPVPASSLAGEMVSVYSWRLPQEVRHRSPRRDVSRAPLRVRAAILSAQCHGLPKVVARLRPIYVTLGRCPGAAGGEAGGNQSGR